MHPHLPGSSACQPRLIGVWVRLLPHGVYVATRCGHSGVGPTEHAALLDLLRKLFLDAGDV